MERKIASVCLALTLSLFASVAYSEVGDIADPGHVRKFESRCSEDDRDLSREDNNLSGAPVSRVEPKYPRDAARQGIEGYVKMEFDISSDGEPVNINVIESYPETTFTQVSVDALKAWRYQPQAGLCKVLTLSYTLRH